MSDPTEGDWAEIEREIEERVAPPLDFATPDDSAYCGVCGKETSLAMIARHLVDEHDIDPEDIANAPIVGDEEPA